MAEEKNEIKPAPAAEIIKKEAVKEPAPIKKEKPANCAACNKSIKKKRLYYRNGKHYCTKRCWKTSLEKKDANTQAAA